MPVAVPVWVGAVLWSVAGSAVLEASRDLPMPNEFRGVQIFEMELQNINQVI